ncbi:MAG: dethiobiotin synthase [Betaproteobacteria bacterium]|nr:dethiobiotin synthase [Betaproteobacteria bacterium]MBI2959303.1 dethiobiotin synthase [Betaproteobacteria bacterium]
MKLLISGTDTGIGKTVATCALLRSLAARSIAALGMKPISAGVNSQGLWDDVEQIRSASPISAPVEDVAPYRLRAAASPHFAAAEDGITIRSDVVLAALERLEQQAEVVLIEGVGGFRVPLSRELDSADLAQAIGAPVLLVVPMRLGCINHALLSAEAIARRGLALAGWLANRGIDPDYARAADTIDTISDRIGTSCLGVLPKLDRETGSAGGIAVDALLARLRKQ